MRYKKRTKTIAMTGTKMFCIAVPNPFIMLFTAVYAALPDVNAPRNTLPRYKAIMGLRRFNS